MAKIDRQPGIGGKERSASPSRLAVVGVLLVLIAGELGARIIEPRLPLVEEWGSSDLDEKAEAMIALADEGAEVVFVGSSAVNRGFDAGLFADLTGRSAFNAAIDGSSPRLLEVLIPELIEPNLRPEIVVIGLTSRSFNDNALTQQELLDRYLASRGRAEFAGTQTLQQRLEGIATDLSSLYRHRSSLRRLELLMRALRGDNNAPSSTDGPYTVDPIWAEQMAARSLLDYQVGELELPALGRVIDYLQENEVRVLLVDLPVVEEDWAALHAHGIEDIAAFHTALAAFAQERGLTLVDTREEAWPIDQFRDPVHLNAVGQARLTRLIAARVADAP